MRRAAVGQIRGLTDYFGPTGLGAPSCLSPVTELSAVAPDGPAAGCRVLELADGPAAAFCGRILSDLGADVVMIEPPEGHTLRGAPPLSPEGVSGRFLYLAAGKRSVTAAPGGGQVAELIAAADLVVTDRRPEEIGPAGAGAKPVVCVSPFGLTGPNRDKRAPHLTLFHSSGESSTLPSGLGYELFPQRPPLQLGSDVAEFDTGWNAALVALALMHDARSSGPAAIAAGPPGLVADISMQESELTLSRTRLNRYLNEGVCVGREGRRYGITGMLRCGDGWIQLVGMRDEHWDRLAQAEEGTVFRDGGFASEEGRRDRTAELGEALTRWCEARPKRLAAALLSEVGAPVGIFADPADCFADEQLAHRGFFRTVPAGPSSQVVLPGPPYRFSRHDLSVGPAPSVGSSAGFRDRPATVRGSPSSPGAVAGQRRQLLEDVRILDFTWAAAGPYATLLLGFLGAEVVKVESVRRLDPARRGFLMQAYDDADGSPVFNELNLNKRSLQIDLTQPESGPIIHEIVGGFDVVVDNFRPGVMARLGLGADALLADHPHLVVASSSANGATGPGAMGAGLASIFAASGGLSTQTGYPDGPPTEVSDTMDYRSGTALAVAIVAALVDRCRTGLGQRVDLSSREVVLASAPDSILAAALEADWPLRVGNGHRVMTPHGVFPSTGGGWVTLAVEGDDEWSGLCAALGRDDWTSRFADPDGRRLAGDDIAAAISEWTASRSADQAAAELQRRGVASAPVMSFEALASDPHLIDRQAVVEIHHPRLGRQRVMRAPWRLEGLTAGPIQPGPCIGADNDYVLAGSQAAAAITPERRKEVFR